MSRLVLALALGSAAAFAPAAAPRADDAPPAPDAPLRVPKVEGAPAPGVMHCLVTPKLLFSVPRDASWRVAGDVPQGVLREGFSRRFPLTIAGLDHLSFEAVGKRELGAAAGGGDPPAVFRLTSSDEAEERILLGILRALERAYESKHRLALDQARTDMLSSSMTFQVMADEIRARQDEARAKFERDTRGLKDSLTSTSKRLFLLEQEKDALTRAVQGHTEANGALRSRAASSPGAEGFSSTGVAGVPRRAASLDARRGSHSLLLDGRRGAAPLE